MDPMTKAVNRENKARILMFAYDFDPQSQIFSHQYRAISEFSKNFNQVFLIVNSCMPNVNKPNNLQIYNLKWNESNIFVSVFRLYFFFFKIIVVFRPKIVFSFMTETHSALVGLFTRMLGIKHLLWYAHVATPIRLKIALFFVNRILTSTKDSISYSSKKVVAIGQMIDENIFYPPANKDYSRREKWIHVGRIDPSKNIEYLIETFLNFQNFNRKMTFEFIGSSTDKNQSYERYLKSKYKDSIDDGSIIFSGKKNSNEICLLLQESDLFCHAFMGSLDKTLIEATLCGLTVVTKNKAYLNEFGPLTKIPTYYTNYFSEELSSWQSASNDHLRIMAEQRRNIALVSHTFSNWILKVNAELAK